MFVEKNVWDNLRVHLQGGIMWQKCIGRRKGKRKWATKEASQVARVRRAPLEIVCCRRYEDQDEGATAYYYFCGRRRSSTLHLRSSHLLLTFTGLFSAKLFRTRAIHFVNRPPTSLIFSHWCLYLFSKVFYENEGNRTFASWTVRQPDWCQGKILYNSFNSNCKHFIWKED